jgi:hypothetical protein
MIYFFILFLFSLLVGVQNAKCKMQKKNSDDTAPYTDSVLRLFQSAKILEQLFNYYSTLSTTPVATPTTSTFSTAAAAAAAASSSTTTSAPQAHYTQIIARIRRIGDFLNLVVCAFVVRDLGAFLAKYNKRVCAWVAE